MRFSVFIFAIVLTIAAAASRPAPDHDVAAVPKPAEPAAVAANFTAKKPRYDVSIATCKFWKTFGVRKDINGDQFAGWDAFACLGQFVNVRAYTSFKASNWVVCGNRCIAAGMCNTWIFSAKTLKCYLSEVYVADQEDGDPQNYLNRSYAMGFAINQYI